MNNYSYFLYFSVPTGHTLLIQLNKNEIQEIRAEEKLQ